MYDSEDLQNINIKYVLYYNKWLYPQKINYSMLEEHKIFFLTYSAKREYQIFIRANDKLIGLGSIHLKVKENDKIKSFQKDGYKFLKIDFLTITTYNTIKNINPEHYKKYVPKPMLTTKLFEIIEENPNTFRQYACNINCPKSPYLC